MSTRLLNKMVGCLLGTAIGDALGYQVEFQHVEPVKPYKVTDFAEHTHRMPDGKAMFSDDTQMAMAVARGLLRSGSLSVEETAEEVAEEFIAWLHDPENTRAPGNACLTGCRNLEAGKHWRESGKPDGRGCGTAMRSMVYGMWSPGATPAAWRKAEELAGYHSYMTHGSDSAAASAAAVAVTVSALLNESDIPPKEAVRLGIVAARRFDDEAADLFEAAVTCAEGKAPDGGTVTPSRVLDLWRGWRGWRGDEAVAASIYCFLSNPDDYHDAVLMAANSPGDSDSLAAITGAFVGAHLGATAIPYAWVDNIEKVDQLNALAARMYGSLAASK